MRIELLDDLRKTWCVYGFPFRKTRSHACRRGDNRVTQGAYAECMDFPTLLKGIVYQEEVIS